MTALQIMVVEDNDELRDATVAALAKSGYQVVSVSSAEDIDNTVSDAPCDLYIIDLNLPGEDGLSLSKRLRAAYPFAGIIMTTARTSLDDRISGYQSGADIYLPKPVAFEELLASLGALAHRIQAKQEQGVDWVLNSRTLIISGPKGLATLSAAEARLVAALAAAPSLTLERWQVIAHLVGEDRDLSASSLQFRISTLRKKLTEGSDQQQNIVAVRDKGYRLCFRVLVQ